MGEPAKVLRLPLYEETPKSPVEISDRLSVNDKCQRCSYHKGVRSVCLPADGEPGGILFVGEHPGKLEDSSGRPFIGDSGRYLRKLVEKLWTGPTAYDYAIRCHVPGEEDSKKARAAKLQAVPQCRPYFAQTLAEAAPQRIIAMGPMAFAAVLGRAPAVYSVRRGVAWVTGPVGSSWEGQTVPVYLIASPTTASRNRFLRQWFEEDLQWAISATHRPIHFRATGRVIQTVEDAEEAEREFRAAPWVAFDLETFGEFFTPDFRVIAAAFCAAGSKDGWLWDRESLDRPETREVFLRILRSKSIEKIAHNIKFELEAIRHAYGFWFNGVRGCTMLQRNLLDSDADADLETCAELVGMGGHKDEAERLILGAVADIQKAREKAKRAAASKQSTFFDEPPPAPEAVGTGNPKAYAYDRLPRPVLLRYVGRDAVSTARLQELLEARLAGEPAISRIWQKVVRHASHAVARVETWGIQADQDALRQFSDYCLVQQNEMRPRFAHYGSTFNPDSSDQVAELLFKKLKLPSKFETDSGKQATHEEALLAIRDRHPIIDDILAWRGVTKLKGTYADGMLHWIRSDGRIHPSININGTETGRLSCSQPNLQNIPRAEDAAGRMARGIFCARPGFSLLEFDYSQLELRVVSMMAEDLVMQEIFQSGADLHLRSAQMIAPILWRRAWDEIPADGWERSFAKTFNFSIVYGKGDETILDDFVAIAKKYGAPIPTMEDVKKVREAILGKFKKLAAWMKNQVVLANRHGQAWTVWDGEPARRRTLIQIADHDRRKSGTAERSSYNTPVQGSANEFCLASLIEVVRWIEQEGIEDLVRVVLTVHDAIELEVHDSMVDEVLWVVPAIMRSWPSKGVPLKVDAKRGQNWGSLEKVKVAA